MKYSLFLLEDIYGDDAFTLVGTYSTIEDAIKEEKEIKTRKTIILVSY